MTGRIAAILRKLEQARSAGAPGGFGAEKHHFTLNPVLPEPELAAFEENHGILLPRDYRDFLLNAGNGGAGPYYGIEPLSSWDQWVEDEAEEDPAFLSTPCPLADDESLREARRAATDRDARRARGEVKTHAGPTDAWGHFLAYRWPEWVKGTINICDQGCTYSARLIVSGASRGRVVYIDAQLWGPPYFVRDRTFLDWYERWLDEVVAGAPSFWFGFDPPAGP